MKKEKAIFYWSGGKDSALCLYKVLREGKYDVTALLTNVNEHYRRITMHGVPESLLDLQAQSIGIPLEKIYLSLNPDNEEYERKTEEVLLRYRETGVRNVIFGDLFLEDLRAYRDAGLARAGMKGVYPLWIGKTGNYREKTKALLEEFIELGFRSITCCVNDKFLGESMAGRELDKSFLADLPADVDPCGENGEYHSFAYRGPVFKVPVAFRTGEKIYRPLEIKTDSASEAGGFWYCDLLPAD